MYLPAIQISPTRFSTYIYSFVFEKKHLKARPGKVLFSFFLSSRKLQYFHKSLCYYKNIEQ